MEMDDVMIMFYFGWCMAAKCFKHDQRIRLQLFHSQLITTFLTFWVWLRQSILSWIIRKATPLHLIITSNEDTITIMSMAMSMATRNHGDSGCLCSGWCIRCPLLIFSKVSSSYLEVLVASCCATVTLVPIMNASTTEVGINTDTKQVHLGGLQSSSGRKCQYPQQVLVECLGSQKSANARKTKQL